MNALDRQRLALDSRTKAARAARAASSARHLFRAGKHLAIAYAALLEMNPRPSTGHLEELMDQVRGNFKQQATASGMREAVIKDYLSVMYGHVEVM